MKASQDWAESSSCPYSFGKSFRTFSVTHSISAGSAFVFFLTCRTILSRMASSSSLPTRSYFTTVFTTRLTTFSASLRCLRPFIVDFPFFEFRIRDRQAFCSRYGSHSLLSIVDYRDSGGSFCNLSSRMSLARSSLKPSRPGTTAMDRNRARQRALWHF